MSNRLPIAGRLAAAGRLGLAAVAALTLGHAAARAETALKFALDWKFEGPAAAYFAGIDQGFFAEAGLSVTIDSGRGSLDAIPKVASGNYEVGFADINSLVKFLDQNPDAGVIAVMMIYDKPPFAIISTKAQGVATPKDLEGKVLGAPAPDGAFAQWAAFTAANGIDAATVTIENVGFPVREPMLASGEVDAITGFSFSSVLNLRGMGVPQEEIVTLLMADHGLSLYGNAIIVNTAYAEANPAVITAFLGAVAKGWAFAIADPETAIEGVMSRNDVADRQTELDRLKMSIADNVLTDYVRANGLGGVDPARFATALGQVAQTYAFQTPPDAAKIFTDAYLPDAAARKID